ncbi:hypothetical protein [Chitinophaga sp. HK235]|uniref:hypothetical protein n=1 Tax=Chitinophaga sp. HK235 TaxID=2952571 RepID=UPI001BABC7D0|nr:hypothetical protein [Chitinophaga sp. HK235]
MSKVISCLIRSFLLVLLLQQATMAQHIMIDTTLANVGDIPFDSLRDDPGFKVCHPDIVFQYYNTPYYYKQHKKEICSEILRQYKPARELAGQNGFVTIRFMINCEGQTGRFRLYCIDENYQPSTFHPALTNQLMEIVKNLKGWQPSLYKGKTYDTYQYLTFHIQQGNIITISP